MPPLRRVAAQRYVEPLREGGSVPAIIEADDLGTYVVKFRGAAQGAKALVAEVIAGELGRALGLPVPEIALCDLDADLGRSEPDAEIRELLRASAGLNLAIDFLPGAAGYDAATFTVAPELAARVVWFDAFVTNVDRTARNTNLLVWHKKLVLIDHGASLYFHHAPTRDREHARMRFPAIREHVLLPYASSIAAADERLAPRVDHGLLENVAAAVPDVWLDGDDRSIYVDYLEDRLRSPRGFVEEAEQARGR